MEVIGIDKEATQVGDIVLEEADGFLDKFEMIPLPSSPRLVMEIEDVREAQSEHLEPLAIEMTRLSLEVKTEMLLREL